MSDQIVGFGKRAGTPLTRRLRRWLEGMESSEAVRSCGGDQKCPWCLQWVNQFLGTRVSPLEADPMLDEITCGHCGGASAWKWEVGFFFVCSTKPPPSASRASDFGDTQFIRDVIQRVKAGVSASTTACSAGEPA